jgi:hypothetical protein
VAERWHQENDLGQRGTQSRSPSGAVRTLIERIVQSRRSSEANKKVLPALAIAAIIWFGSTTKSDQLPEAASSHASALPAQLASSHIIAPPLRSGTAPQPVSTTQSDIIVRKVKTQSIESGAW